MGNMNHNAEKPKADTMSASNQTRAFDPRTDLTANEAKVVREFVEKGKTLDRPVREFLALARKVKAIFAKKTRGIPVLFEGRYYMSFEKLVDEKFPRSSRTIRRWLAEVGETDQRFTNKTKPKSRSQVSPACGDETAPATNESKNASVTSEPQPEIAPENAIATMKARRDAKIRSAVGYPHQKLLPTNFITVYEVGWRQGYEVGWRQGYADALANVAKRKGMA